MAARPAPLPMATAERRVLPLAPTTPADSLAMEAPIWMEGPSGPTGRPPPMATPLASSFTRATFQPIGTGSPRSQTMT
ncbi:hypothetical protein AAJV73_05080 [Cyanobium sp. BSA11S]